MANGIAGFGGLNFFFIIILNELTIKCVIRFGRFCKKSRGPMELAERDCYFYCLVE